MYVPRMFQHEDKEDIYRYIQANGFATLVGQSDGRPIASHIPMHLNRTNPELPTLLAHIAKPNKLKYCLDDAQELLAIFMNTHAYVSSSWYDHVNVPTWNYISVHIYGKAKIIEGKELVDSIKKLVDQYEDGRSGRFHMTDMSTEEQKAHFKGLVGFEMSIDEIVPAYKLSQNRNDHDYHNVAKELKNQNDQGSNEIANQMNKLRS